MYVIAPDPGRKPPSLTTLRRYNANRAFDIRPAYPAQLGQVNITEGPGVPFMPEIIEAGPPQYTDYSPVEKEKQLTRWISSGQFARAWQSGLVPSMDFQTKDGIVKVPSKFFNWSQYRFGWDAAEAAAKRKGRSLIMATHPKIYPFSADDINQLWALTIHEDGGPVQYTGDKMRRFLSTQANQMQTVPRRIAYFKIPAMAIAPSRERRKISESLLKAGTMAVAVVGASFLGNAIVGKLGAGAAEGAAAAAGTSGASVGAAIVAGEAAAVGISVPILTPTITATIAGQSVVAGSVIAKAGVVGAASLLSIVAENAPKVINTINTTRTITAMAKGELPPPPIRPMDGSFTDWAMLVAQDKLQRKLTEAEEELLLEQIMSGQQGLALYGGNSPQTAGSLDPRIVAIQGQEKDKIPGWLMLLPIAALFMMS